MPSPCGRTVNLVEKSENRIWSPATFFILFRRPSFLITRLRAVYLGDDEIERVKRGECAIHHDSILIHPEKKLAVDLGQAHPFVTTKPRFYFDPS